MLRFGAFSSAAATAGWNGTPRDEYNSEYCTGEYPDAPLGEILGVGEKRASVADAEGVRIEVLIGRVGRMVNGGLEPDTSAVVELCDSAVVLVINVERERDTAVLWQGSRPHCYNPPDSYPTDSSAERMIQRDVFVLR